MKHPDWINRLVVLSFILIAAMFAARRAAAQEAPVVQVHIDESPEGRLQTIDGFGTCHNGVLSHQPWYTQLYYDDLGASIVRIDLVPRFKKPWSDLNYYSPWFMGSGTRSVFNIEDKANPGGPEANRARTYRSPDDYSRPFGGKQAPIAVMTPDIVRNQQFFDYSKSAPLRSLIQAGQSRQKHPGDFKLVGSIWSPAPWLKEANGQIWEGGDWPLPTKGTPYPFIWGGNFSGGRLDTSERPLELFNDGTGPTSALTQFARSTAAYIKGLQETFHVQFYAISIQNEVNFPEFYNSCVYRTSEEYIKALKAVRHEFDQHPDLRAIRFMGPEDVIGQGIWGLWQYGGGNTVITHKNLQYLRDIAKDPQANKALDFFNIHGYAPDGATASGADAQLWTWWTSGWDQSPTPGIPAHVKGFMDYGKKSWMTETSGETNRWIAPAKGLPTYGGWGIAFKTHQALTVGRQSAILYWQFAEKLDQTTKECLTQAIHADQQPKYVAAKHFFKFIRPGSVALRTVSDDAQSIVGSAYWHEQDQRLTIVLINRSPAPRTASIRMPALTSAKALRTFSSAHDALWQKQTVQIGADRLAEVIVPGYGVVTLTTDEQ